MNGSALPSTLTGWLDYISAQHPSTIAMGLNRVRAVWERILPGPCPQAPINIIVGGTNGKGSTCDFMHSILQNAGVNTGLFTSPHLVHFGERIRDAERMISPAEIAAGINRLRERVSGWNPHPTFFELTLVGLCQDGLEIAACNKRRNLKLSSFCSEL